MSGSEIFLIYWTLPSLVLLLGGMLYGRYIEDDPVEEWDEEDWMLAILFSVIYPLFFLGLLAMLWLKVTENVPWRKIFFKKVF